MAQPKKSSLSYQKIIIGILVICFFIPVTAFKPVTINGPAMGPNYPQGAQYLIFKYAYVFSPPKRGDIVIFHYTKYPQYVGINRVIGLPGDTLKIQDGKVFINNQELNERYLAQGSQTMTFGTRDVQQLDENWGSLEEVPDEKFINEGQELTISDGNYFMMGDDRVNSIDSRSLGFVEQKDIIGRLMFRYK